MQRKDGTPKRVPTPEEYEERLASCETEMLRQASHYRVASVMMVRFGVTRRTAQEWIAKVLGTWGEGAAPIESVEHNRTKAEARARFLEVYRLATGGVWTEVDPSDPSAEPRLLTAPNLKVANDVAIRLAQLDGHLTPKGPPVPPPEVGEDPVVLEIRDGLKSIKDEIAAKGSVQALIDEQPAMPSEEDRNPRAVLRQRNEELAALRARVTELEARAAVG